MRACAHSNLQLSLIRDDSAAYNNEVLDIRLYIFTGGQS